MYFFILYISGEKSIMNPPPPPCSYHPASIVTSSWVSYFLSLHTSSLYPLLREFQIVGSIWKLTFFHLLPWISWQEGALTAFRKTYDKTVALGHRLDIVFYLLRIGLFYMDNDLITRNTEKAKRYFLMMMIYSPVIML